jgi:hypothetical protein
MQINLKRLAKWNVGNGYAKELYRRFRYQKGRKNQTRNLQEFREFYYGVFEFHNNLLEEISFMLIQRHLLRILPHSVVKNIAEYVS